MGSLATLRRIGWKQRKEEWGCQPMAVQERVRAALTDVETERTAIFAKHSDVDLTGFANKVW